MADNVTNELIFEQLKRIQEEQAASRERDKEILLRLSHIETSVARVGRDQAMNYAEIVDDRHVVDRIKERLERIERRLELNDT